MGLETDFIMKDETQLNQAILTVDAKAAIIAIPIPKYKKTKVTIVKRNEKTGEPELNEDGTNILLEGEITEFDGYEDKLQNFPVPDCFNNDLAKSNLLDKEINFVRVAQHSYLYYLQEYIYTKNEEYLSMMCFTAGLLNSTINSTRGRYGFSVEWAKKKVTKTEGAGDLEKIKAQEEISNQGILARLPFFGNKNKPK